MVELNIKKDAFYRDLSYLEIQSFKDEEGKACIDLDQANSVRQLRVHVQQTGKRKGFVAPQTVSNVLGESSSAIVPPGAPLEQNGLANVEMVQPQSEQELIEAQIMAGASALAANQMTMPQQVMLGIAGQMQYGDLLPGDKAKVDAINSACSPKAQAASLAAKMLAKHRKGAA
jgi:hypothetical protein